MERVENNKDIWYTASYEDETMIDFWHMFWEFHDFRIIKVNYEAQKDLVEVLFEYDDKSIRILVKFIGNVEFYVASTDFECDYIEGATLHRYKNQIRWIKEEIDGTEFDEKIEGITYFQGNVVNWSLVDENNNHQPVKDDLFHQCFNELNYETGKYEEKIYDFIVKLK